MFLRRAQIFELWKFYQQGVLRSPQSAKLRMSEDWLSCLLPLAPDMEQYKYYLVWPPFIIVKLLGGGDDVWWTGMVEGDSRLRSHISLAGGFIGPASCRVGDVGIETRKVLISIIVSNLLDGYCGLLLKRTLAWAIGFQYKSIKYIQNLLIELLSYWKQSNTNHTPDLNKTTIRDSTLLTFWFWIQNRIHL